MDSKVIGGDFLMRSRWIRCLALSIACAGPHVARANTGAAALGAGGLQFRSEPRVAIRSERLELSLDRVRVHYVFVNGSDEEVVTDVAFPLPPHGFDLATGGAPAVQDVRITVAGKAVPIAPNHRALLRGQDVTDRVRGAGLSIETLARAQEPKTVSGGGQWSGDGAESELARLPPAVKERLLGQGLIEAAPGYQNLVPMWEVQTTYHWRQRFPARGAVEMSVEYRPVIGFETELTERDWRAACADGEVRAAVTRGRLAASWVEYILTTAATWKRPIEKFEMVIEAPRDAILSVCWSGKIETVSPGRYRSVVKKFEPAGELRVYFFRKPEEVLR